MLSSATLPFILFKVCQKKIIINFPTLKMRVAVCNNNKRHGRGTVARNVEICLNRRKYNIDEATLGLVYPKSSKGFRLSQAVFARAPLPRRLFSRTTILIFSFFGWEIQNQNYFFFKS